MWPGWVFEEEGGMEDRVWGVGGGGVVGVADTPHPIIGAPPCVSVSAVAGFKVVLPVVWGL